MLFANAVWLKKPAKISQVNYLLTRLLKWNKDAYHWLRYEFRIIAWFFCSSS